MSSCLRASAQGKPPQRKSTEYRELAKSRGKTGVIRVLARGKLRVLMINDVVQAEVMVGRRHRVDALVSLLHAVRPRAETAFVAGLGSGNTALALRQNDVKVQAVDVEPKVIEYARRYFGYKGHAQAMDALKFLKKSWRVYDLVLMDAFVGDKTPSHLISPRALKLIWNRVYLKGVLAIRLLASPTNARVQQLVRQVMALEKKTNHSKKASAAHETMNREREVYVRLFGSGVGNERQNLYLLVSNAPLSVKSPRGLCLWQIPLDDINGQHGASVGDVVTTDRKVTVKLARNAVRVLKKNTDNSRKMLVAGHLVRVPGKKGLFLYPPHPEMGALRFQLSGPLAVKLMRYISSDKGFPTSGGMSSDGDLRQTNAELMFLSAIGGARQRFSTVLAGLEGSVRLMVSAGQTNTYLMQIRKVHFTLSFADWKRFKRAKLNRVLNRSARLFARGRLDRASKTIGIYLQLLNQRLSEMGHTVPLYGMLQRLKRLLDAQLAKRNGNQRAGRSAAHFRLETCRLLYFDSALMPKVLKKGLVQCEKNSQKSISGYGDRPKPGRQKY